LILPEGPERLKLENNKEFAVNRGQLIDKIKENPALQKFFGGRSRLFVFFCPICLQKALDFPDQGKLEVFLDALIQYESISEVLESKIQKLAGDLQKQLKEAQEGYGKTVIGLFEILKPENTCNHGYSDLL